MNVKRLITKAGFLKPNLGFWTVGEMRMTAQKHLNKKEISPLRHGEDLV